MKKNKGISGWFQDVADDIRNLFDLTRMKWSNAFLMHILFFALTWAEIYSFGKALDIALTHASLSGSSADFLLDKDNPVAVYAADLNKVIDEEIARVGGSNQPSKRDIKAYQVFGGITLSSVSIVLLIAFAIETTNKRRISAAFTNAKRRFSLLDRRFGLAVLLMLASL